MMDGITTELERLIGNVIGNRGKATNAALVIAGNRFGVYKYLDEIGPRTPQLLKRVVTDGGFVNEPIAPQHPAPVEINAANDPPAGYQPLWISPNEVLIPPVMAT